MKRAWAAWVALWDRREPPAALALVRMFVGLVLVADFLNVARLGLVGPMYTAAPDGYAVALGGWAREILDAGLGPTLWAIGLAASVCLMIGLATRAACATLVVVMSQLAWLASDADRGIHMILRVVLAILALSCCHAQWSVDAWLWRRLGRPFPARVPAWPRYLLLLQLVWIYFSGGINKSGAEWGPAGGFLALSNALTDPHMARFDPAWVGAVMPLTRIATAVTMLFELSAPLYLVWLYCAETADRPGRARHWINRLRLRWLWIATGIAFHLGLVIALPIGVFPWGMLALYPVLLRPTELTRGG